MTTPQIDGDGKVTIDGQRIGFVWKSTRTYSPPTHKGSRVVKYRKEVPCWQAGQIKGWGLNPTFDTRKAGVQWLVDIWERMEVM